MKKEDNIKEKINEIFTRGIGEFIDPEGVFRKKLETDPKSIVIKLGADPNRPDIHLGHAVVLRKLRAFQDLGCKVIFLVGDYTAQIGDPTGKNKVRPDTEQAEIEKNAQTYISQIEKILRTDQEVFSWIRNSHWFYSASSCNSNKSNLPRSSGTGTFSIMIAVSWEEDALGDLNKISGNAGL